MLTFPIRTRSGAKMTNDLVAFFKTLDANAKGRFPGAGLNTSHLDTLVIAPDAPNGGALATRLRGARDKGWLPGAAGAVGKDPFFSVLDAAGVGFYEVRPTGLPSTGPAGPLPSGACQRLRQIPIRVAREGGEPACNPGRRRPNVVNNLSDFGRSL